MDPHKGVEMVLKQGNWRIAVASQILVLVMNILMVIKSGAAQGNQEEEFFVSLDVDSDEDGESGSLKSWEAHLDNSPPLVRPFEQVYHFIYDPIILGQPADEDAPNKDSDLNRGGVNSTAFLEIHIRHFAPKKNRTAGNPH